NGQEVGADDDVITLDQYDITPYLQRGENTLKVWTQTNTWWTGVFACAAIELADGRKVEILTDGSWQWAVPEEEERRQSAGEVVQGVNGGFWNNVGRIMVMPDAWYRLNRAVEAPGIAWARPYAGRAPNVLAVHSRGTQRDTVELAQRTDMRVRAVLSDLYNFNYEHSTMPFFPVTRGMFAQDVQAELQNALAERPDVIILGGMGRYKVEDVFHGSLAEPLEDLLARGGGLVYVTGAIPARTVAADEGDKPTQDRSYEQELTATPLEATPAFLATGVPYRALPGFNRSGKGVKGLEQAATLFTYGKGRIVRLNGRIFGGYGLFANVPSDSNDLHYQYYMSFAVKTILWAAGQEPSVQFEGFPQELTVTRGEGRGRLAFTLSGVPKDCRVALAIRSPKKLYPLPAAPLASQGLERGAPVLRPVYEAEQAVNPGARGQVAFDLPPLPVGSYFLDVLVYSGDKKASWATAHLEVKSSLDIAEVKASKDYIDLADGKSDEIGATVTLTGAAPKETSVRFSLFDNYDRLLAIKEVQVAAGRDKASVTFPVKEFSTCLGKVRAELLQGEEVEAFESAPFTTIRRDWDQFIFMNSYGGSSGHQGNVYRRALAGLGVDATFDGVTLPMLEAADRVALSSFPITRKEVADAKQVEEEYRARAGKIIESQMRFDPIAFRAGDESHYGGGDEKPARIEGLRQFLRARYKAIAALNAAWDSDYASFGEIYPVTGDATALEGEGAFVSMVEFTKQAEASRNYARLVDQWMNNYKVYADLAKASLKSMKALYPQARLGMFAPMWPQAHSGHDWYTSLQEFDFFAPYARGGEIIPLKQARSYARPGQLIAPCYGGYLYMAFNRKEELTDTAWHKYTLWNLFLQGFNGLCWYNMNAGANESNLGPGFEPYPTLDTAAGGVARIRQGYYKLFSRAQRDYGPIAMHDSIVSRLTTAFMPAGLSSGSTYSRPMDMHVLMHLLETVCGYPYTFVSDNQIEQGELTKYRVLMMPLSTAVGKEQAKALEEFLREGGILVADVRPGLFDGSGRWDEKQTVPSLFGLKYNKGLGRKMLSGPLQGTFLGKDVNITPTQPFPADSSVKLNGAEAVCKLDGVPLVTVNKVGKGRAICLNIPSSYSRTMEFPDSLYAYWGDKQHNELIESIIHTVLDALEIERPLKVEVQDGRRWAFGLETSLHVDGKVQYVGITKRRERDDEPARRITVQMPKAGHVYDMLSSRYLGKASSWKADVDQVDVQLFSVLPYRVRGLQVSLDQDAPQSGQVLKGRVDIQKAGRGTAVRHVIHLEAIRPDGKRPRYLAQTLETEDGRAAFRIPLALNEPKGEWTLKLTDTATQTSTQAPFTVH
ncbi:MAG: hypothetical protein QGH74_08640, partial [Candidatus Brocadiia bacterium]|nr:hypothetical protein [Candidatus Brocadiia bacterium]